MLCCNCKRNEATVHIKQIIGGEATEKHLCAECAGEMGYADMFSGFSSLSLSSLFNDLTDVGRRLPQDSALKCKKCGSTFADIVRDNRLGCSECYRTFADRLRPSVERIHGRGTHNGKRIDVDAAAVEQPNDTERIAALKARLSDCIERQDFEQAAKLRDEIKELEGRINHG